MYYDDNNNSVSGKEREGCDNAAEEERIISPELAILEGKGYLL